MSKTMIRITPYGGYDIWGLEKWLSKMAQKGARFCGSTSIFTCFERMEPQQVQIHLEPILGAAEENEELTAIYESSGWQYWGMFRGSFYVFASADIQAEAYTDKESWTAVLKRFYRDKAILGGLLLALNILLLGFYQNGAPWKIGAYRWKYFPMEALFDFDGAAYLLVLTALIVSDLSYLLGMMRLREYRRAIQRDLPMRRRIGTGWLSALSLVLMLPVLLNVLQCFFGMDYRPMELEESGFVTLQEIEGDGLRLSGDRLMSMDFVSHGGTLLWTESWYLQQNASFGSNQDWYEVPHFKVSVRKYPLEGIAKKRMEEHRRVMFNGADLYAPVEHIDSDEAWYAGRDGKTRKDGSIRLPGGVLLMRRGTLVLHVDYYGYQNLSEHADQFARMLAGL